MRKHQVSLLLLGLLFPIAIQAVSLTDSLRQAIYKSIGDEESEGNARWNLIATLGNEVMDSLLLAEAPEQMNWFMHHQQWEHYYDTWDSKINVYLYTEHLQTALREAQTMLDDASSRDNRYGRAMAYQSLGIIYELLGLFDQSVDVFQCCIAQLKNHYPNANSLTNAYDYLSQSYDERGEYAKELAITKEWEQCVKKRMANEEKSRLLHYPTYVACLSNKASALTGLKRLDEAGKELLRADILLSEITSSLLRYRVLYVRVKYELAKGNAQQALIFSDSLQALGLAAGGDTQLLRADIFQMLGQADEAVRILRNEYQAKDTIFTREMRMQLNELNTLYQLEELNMQRQLERTRFITGLIGLVAVALLLITFFRHRAARQLEEEHRLLQMSNEKLETSNRELKKANDKAVNTSKMKNDFIRQISHEIRTPLNVLGGFTQILTSPDIEIDDVTKANASKRIMDNTKRITELVDKLLELSDANSQTVIERSDKVKAIQIAQQAVKQSGIVEQNRLQFTLQATPENGELTLLTNLQKACRVLVLLLHNARKFTKKGSVTLSIERQGAYVCFMVTDTGIGIPVEEAQNIFEEFVQLDEYYDGAGIGLTVARSLARRMGGDVTLDTTYTEGARFAFTLPIA